MNRVMGLVSLLALFALTVGCVPSVFSIFSEENVMEDPALEGVWQFRGEVGPTWTITPMGRSWGKQYRLVIEFSETHEDIHDPPRSVWNLRIGKIGDHQFIEIRPQPNPAVHPGSFYGGHFERFYSFWKVGIDGDELSLVGMSMPWLERQIEVGAVQIAHVERESELLLLTASTEALQAFVLAHADNREAFATGGEKAMVMRFLRVLQAGDPEDAPGTDSESLDAADHERES